MTGTASSSLAAVPPTGDAPTHPVGPAEPNGRPLRKDAQRNRDLLLTVAAEQFSAHGVDVPLEDVARVAGVGIGTLYRHFPTRGALIEAVYRREVEQLCDSADELLRTLTPDDALAAWMRNFVTYASTKRGLSAALRDMMSAAPELFTDTRARIYAAANSVLAAAAADGAIRSDVDAEDLIRGMGGICMATDDDGYTERANKLMTLMLDGMRHGAGRTG
jgi:AcrR family transcriptional regulator